MREYNNRTLFELFNNNFLNDCGIQNLSINPISSGYSITPPPPILQYLLSATSYHLCRLQKPISNLTSPCDPQTIRFPSSGILVTDHNMMKDGIIFKKQRRVYCARYQDGKIQQKHRFYWYIFSIHKKVYCCHGLTRQNLESRNLFIWHQHCMALC